VAITAPQLAAKVALTRGREVTAEAVLLTLGRAVMLWQIASLSLAAEAAEPSMTMAWSLAARAAAK
jgi:hypothetical protein